MLSHEQVWAAIDALAAQNGLSPSGLARRAGLDPTTFNPSKRIAGDGRPRWPSTESLAKILEATGEPLSQFVARVDDDSKASRMGGRHILSRQQLPFAGFPRPYVAGTPSTAMVSPAGPGWAQLSFPDPKVKDAFALEVTGDGFMPLYRAGDIIIAACSLPIRRGDRVVVKQAEGALSNYDPCPAPPGPDRVHNCQGPAGIVYSQTRSDRMACPDLLGKPVTGA